MLLVMMLRIVIYAPIMGIGALTKVSGNAMSWIIALAVLVIISVVIILFSIVMPKFKIVQKLIDKLNLVAREIKFICQPSYDGYDANYDVGHEWG